MFKKKDKKTNYIYSELIQMPQKIYDFEVNCGNNYAFSKKRIIVQKSFNY